MLCGRGFITGKRENDMLGSKPKTSSRTATGLSGKSIIGADVTITGNVTATGDIHLDGTINGDVRCASLIVGGSGKVKGHIAAEKALIAGQIEGSIAVHALAVEASARITGDMAYETVRIAQGAHVDGRVSHRIPGDEAQPLQLVAQSAD